MVLYIAHQVCFVCMLGNAIWNTHTCAHTCTHTHTHAHACTHIYTRAYARAHTHTHSLPHAHASTHMYTCICMHARTHMHTHTHEVFRPILWWKKCHLSGHKDKYGSGWRFLLIPKEPTKSRQKLWWTHMQLWLLVSRGLWRGQWMAHTTPRHAY